MGNPLSMKIYNTLLIDIDKDTDFEKFNGETDPITHL